MTIKVDGVKSRPRAAARHAILSVIRDSLTAIDEHAVLEESQLTTHESQLIYDQMAIIYDQLVAKWPEGAQYELLISRPVKKRRSPVEEMMRLRDAQRDTSVHSVLPASHNPKFKSDEQMQADNAKAARDAVVRDKARGTFP